MYNSDNFDRGYLMGNKGLQKTNNDVEIPPEMQAEMDRAIEAAKVVRDNEVLASGLSGNNKKDLSKGVTIQGNETDKINLGNGITKITNSDGTIEYELDYAKGYDGSAQMFAEGTKVTILNAPEAPKKNFLQKVGDILTSINEWGNRASGGNIKKLGSGAASLTGTVVAATVGPSVINVAAAAGLASLASCTKKDLAEPTIVNVSTTNKAMVDYVVNYLNDPNNELGFIPETSDGVSFEYLYDYNPQNDFVRPYIKIGDDIKLYINTNPLQNLTTGNIVNYIDIIGDELVTNDGVQYNFEADGNDANVIFSNGLIHTVGEDISIDKEGTTASLYALLGSAGFVMPEQESQIIMNLEANEGSYGNGAPGFAMEVVTPAKINDITNGNPVIKGNVGTYNFEGKAEKVEAEKYQLEANGQTKMNAAGGIHISNNDGEEIYMQYEEGFDLQSAWDEPGMDYNIYDGIVVYVKEQGSNLYKEKYIMSKFDDTRTDIGLIDRENGTTLQNYPSSINTFDTKGAVEAENYYLEKQKNLREAYEKADENFRYLMQWHFEANAEVTIE